MMRYSIMQFEKQNLHSYWLQVTGQGKVKTWTTTIGIEKLWFGVSGELPKNATCSTNDMHNMHYYSSPGVRVCGAPCPYEPVPCGEQSPVSFPLESSWTY